MIDQMTIPSTGTFTHHSLVVDDVEVFSGSLVLVVLALVISVPAGRGEGGGVGERLGVSGLSALGQVGMA